MAEALIWIEDKVARSHPLRALNYGEGDVIVVMPDGWGWTRAELGNPQWKLLKGLAGTPEQYANLLLPVYAPITGELTQKRDVGLDFTKLSAATRTAILDADEEITLTSAQRTEVLASATKRAAAARVG